MNNEQLAIMSGILMAKRPETIQKKKERYIPETVDEGGGFTEKQKEIFLKAINKK